MSVDERAGIGDLIDRHFDAVYGYVAFRLAPHHDAAADISQEVFGAALHTPPPADAARAWLLRVARHKIADHYRRRERWSPEPLSVGDERIDPGLTTVERERRDRALMVAEVMRRLDPGQADLLEDKYLRGRSVKQIAEERGTTIKTIESALTRARDAFRRTMNELELAQESTP